MNGPQYSAQQQWGHDCRLLFYPILLNEIIIIIGKIPSRTFKMIIRSSFKNYVTVATIHNSSNPSTDCYLCWKITVMTRDFEKYEVSTDSALGYICCSASWIKPTTHIIVVWRVRNSMSLMRTQLASLGQDSMYLIIKLFVDFDLGTPLYRQTHKQKQRPRMKWPARKVGE